MEIAGEVTNEVKISMVDLLKPGVEERNSIIVQTRLRRNIVNYQSKEFSCGDLIQAEEIRRSNRDYDVRTEIDPTYNCHGLTFASRRTAIPGINEVAKILEDDGYVPVPSSQIIAGDIVIYYSDNGDAEHSGLLLDVSKINPLLSKVLSKWGHAFEVVHPVATPEYSCRNIKFYRMKYEHRI